MQVKTNLEMCQQLMEDAGIPGIITSTEGQTGEKKRVTQWIARATTEIEGRWFNWNFLHQFLQFSTIVGVSDYPAPAGLNLWDKDTFNIVELEQIISFMDWNRIKNRSVPLEDGDPYRVTVLPAKTLRFFDTPTQILTINAQYWRVPTVLIASGDEPSIPEQFRDVIVSKALQYYANFESADESKLSGIETFEPRMLQLESSELPANQAQGNINTGADIQVVASGYEYDRY